MSEYTPTTEKVRFEYAEWASADWEQRQRESEFDRWLADHDAEVCAQTLVQARQIAEVRAGVVAEEPEAPRIISTEAEANSLPVGSIIRDNMGDARQKVSDRGWEQSGVVGWWGPTWVAFPAEVLWAPVKHEGAGE